MGVVPVLNGTTVVVELRNAPTYEQACLEIVRTAERCSAELHKAEINLNIVRARYNDLSHQLRMARKTRFSSPYTERVEKAILSELSMLWRAQERYYDLMLKYEGRNLRR